jgi:hypothetical protein
MNASQIATPTTIANSAYSGVKLKPGTNVDHVERASSGSRFVAR